MVAQNFDFEVVFQPVIFSLVLGHLALDYFDQRVVKSETERQLVLTELPWDFGLVTFLLDIYDKKVLCHLNFFQQEFQQVLSMEKLHMAHKFELLILIFKCVFLHFKLQKFGFRKLLENPYLLTFVFIFGIFEDVGARLFSEYASQFKIEFFQTLVFVCLILLLFIGLGPVIKLLQINSVFSKKWNPFPLDRLPIRPVHVHRYSFCYKILGVVATDYLIVKDIVLRVKYLDFNYFF